MDKKIGHALKLTTLSLVLFCCLFGDPLGTHGPFREQFDTWESFFLGPICQWMIFVLACVWCVGLIVLTYRPHDFWLLCFISIAICAYSTNYSGASSDYRAMNLIVAVTVGKAFYAFGDRKLVLFCLAAFLTASSFLHVNNVAGFYHGTRWTGPWNDPNLYGMLMGVGFVLALGVFNTALSLTNLLIWTAIFLLGLGLLESYSRGAWCGTAVALIYLSWQLSEAKRRRFLTVAGILGCVLILSCFHGVKWLPVHRVATVMNVNDFSWRNRIAAWQRALQIMATCPWRGVGWSLSDEVDRYYYMPIGSTDSALFTNSYAVLGAELGLPALTSFIIYLCNKLGFKPERQMLEFEDSRICREAIICRAGAIVLAVSFLFDGRFFDLSTGVVFWILLEMGSMDFSLTERRADNYAYAKC